MAISPPGWCRGAIPTKTGWRDPNTNELLKSMSISQAQIDEFFGLPTEPEVEMLTEAPSAKSMWDMSKRELEDLGRQHGIELDRRQNKTALIEELEEAGIEV